MQMMIFADVAAKAQSAFANIKERIDQYILESGPEFLGKAVAAAVIFFVGKWLAGFAQRMLARVLDRAKLDVTLSKFICRLVYGLMLVWVCLASLDKLGINTTSLAAVIAAAGLAIGLSLQGSLANFAAGVTIILFRPFKVGDMIEAGGTKGIVEEIHIFNTMLRTGDNVDIIVPNSAVISGNITNYSSKPERRVDLVVGCGYGDDLLAVKNFLHELVLSDPRVLREPAPVIAVSELGDSSVNLIVRPWVKSADYWAVRWDLTEKIKLGFDELGFTIPFPQQDIHLHAADAESTPSAVARPEPTLAPAAPSDGRLRPRRVA